MKNNNNDNDDHILACPYPHADFDKNDIDFVNNIYMDRAESIVNEVMNNLNKDDIDIINVECVTTNYAVGRIVTLKRKGLKYRVQFDSQPFFDDIEASKFGSILVVGFIGGGDVSITVEYECGMGDASHIGKYLVGFILDLLP
jgi:hypothetical protein